MDLIIPEDLYFYLTNRLGDCVLFKMDGDVLLYSESVKGQDILNIEPIRVKPKISAWKNFWVDVRNVGVWYWRAHYNNPAPPGNGDWELELKVADKHILSEGMNAYPPSNDDFPPEAFRQLLRAFGELMGDKAFIKRWHYRLWE